MANTIYRPFMRKLAKNDIDWDAAVIRCLLERSTSAYSPDEFDEWVSDLSGLVEISVASYTRQTASGQAVTDDTGNILIKLEIANISWGTLETGQTVKALIFYVQTGGNDSTPGNDPLICRIDRAAGLPAILSGGTFGMTVNVDGFIQMSQG